MIGPSSYAWEYETQPTGYSPYPNEGKEPPVTTPAKTRSLLALLSEGDVFIPPTDFSTVAAGLQSVSRVCGKLTRIVNAASTSVVLVNSIRNNVNGFGLMVGVAVINQAARDAGVDPNAIVQSAIRRANELVNAPLKFLETCFRARRHAQASFTMSGIADVFGALRSVSQLLQACKTFTDLISGGVTARFGPNADNTVAGARLRASGIRISGDQIRTGIAVVTDAMRRLGTLWDPNDPDTIGTPNGMVMSLQKQGIADKIGLRQPLLDQGVFLDDELDVKLASPYVLLEALRQITGPNLKRLISLTHCNPINRANVLTAADLCRGDVLIGQTALDNIPYGDLNNFGKQIASFGIKNKVTWLEIADVLDSLELPDIGLIDTPNFANDMGTLSQYLGSGSGLFGDATMYDFLGTAAGFAHTDAFTRISQANDALENTAEGRALMVALEFYEEHENPNDPLNNTAEVNLIAALEAVKDSTDPVVQQAVADANQGILDSALQLVSEITNAVATGYGIYTTVATLIAIGTRIGQAIAQTARNLGNDGGVLSATEVNAGLVAAAATPEGIFQNGLRGVLRMLGQILDIVADATGIYDLIAECCNPNTTGGQAMRAMLAETANSSKLGALGMKVPQVDIEDAAARKRARFGFGLSLEQQNIIAAYSREKGLTAGETEDLLFLNAYYGYQRHYFEKVAGLYERARWTNQTELESEESLAGQNNKQPLTTTDTAQTQTPQQSLADALTGAVGGGSIATAGVTALTNTTKSIADQLKGN